MAGILDDDESTDDEFGMNLHLAERLRINRGENSNFMEDNKFENSKDFKQYCNMRRKKFAQEGQSSSSSSVEVQNDNPTSVLTSSDIYHNKKRQNGDKNTEQLANPKRTCLSDRFHRTPDWQDLRKKMSNHNGHSERPLFSDSFYLQPSTSSDLFPDRKKGEQINSLADEDDSDFEIPLKFKKHSKVECGETSKTCNNHSSSISSKNQIQNFESKPSTSYFKFLDSSSEDESKSIMQNGALKGGRQDSTSDHNYYSERLFGRKMNKKLLDSDESEDDTSATAYRSRPLVFSSSDSEDFRQTSAKTKQISPASNGSTGHSHFYGDGLDKNSGHNSKQYKPFRPNQKFSKKAFCSTSNRAESSEGCDRPFLSSDFQRKNIPHRPCRSRRSPRINMTSNLLSNGFTNGNSLSAPVRGRRISGGERGGRRSGSPHHRSNRYQHKSEDSKCRGRSVSAPRSQKEMPSYAARFPDVFDAEESENEYFTANSYSDTETSTESFGGLTINTTFSHHPQSISCTFNCEDTLFENGTTDDEISVVFSSGPYGGTNNVSSRGTSRAEDDVGVVFSAGPYGRSNESNQGTARADDEISVVFSTGPYGRNNESRRGSSRTLGRRHNRGTHRQLQNAREVVSLSPDPVEQVRQMEEDERMARMLQAQFDAELDSDYIPHVSHTRYDFEDESDDDDDDDNIIDPVGDTDSDEPTNATYPITRFPVTRRGFGIHRLTSRSESPIAIFLNSPRINHRRRPHFPQTRRPENQLPRIFGLGLHDMVGLFAEEDDYETLLSLDLDGEIYPRGLPKSDINRLPTRKYVHPNSGASCSSEVTHKRTELNKECQVCLTDYETGDILRILPCFHEFHTPCIDPWLSINHTCPVCRVTVDLDG